MRRLPQILLAVVWLANGPGLCGQDVPHTDPGIPLPPAVGRWLSTEFRQLDDRRIRLNAELATLPATPQNEQSARLGWKIFGYGGGLPPLQWVEIDLGAVQPVDAVALLPVDEPTPETGGPGYGFPRRFRVEIHDGSAAPTTLPAPLTQ